MLTRKSIDTDTLYNVSRALNYDFALLYSIHKEQINYDTLEQESIGSPQRKCWWSLS